MNIFIISIYIKEVINIYESFENLKESKRQIIINAGYKIFGEYGYSKASVEDIVKDAGISKGSLFYHFGSKKNYFLYLYEYSADKMKQLVDSDNEDGLPSYMENTDFFERLDAVKGKKMKLAILHPYMISFIKKAAFEDSHELHTEIQLINQKLIKERTADFFFNLDSYKFKDCIDPSMVLQLISWCSEGCANHIKMKNMMNPEKNNEEIDFGEVITLYDQYVAMIRTHFYKDKYL
jgi:AcrR family transcriptional regulator